LPYFNHFAFLCVSMNESRRTFFYTVGGKTRNRFWSGHHPCSIACIDRSAFSR
jgi:hypothetical protein